MNRLPDEILLMTFRRVDDFREKLKLELVCRRWRKIMRDHGWKHLRQVANRQNRHGLTPHKWAVPIGERCGNRLVECSFYSLNIYSNLMRLIAGNLRALRHLTFYSCQLGTFDANVLDPFPEFGAHLRSLTLFMMDYHPQLGHNLLRYFPRLHHLGLNFSYHQNYSDDICPHFSVNLRSLYLNCFDSSDLEQMLAVVQTTSPGITALYLDTITPPRRNSALLRVSELKNLRFLNLSAVYDSGLLSSCLANLPQLRALQMSLDIKQLSADVFRSPSFRGLVHLRLSLLFAYSYDNFGHIGFLATAAPQLRSFSLNIPHRSWTNELDQFPGIARQLLKIANNGKLEHLNMPCASFSIVQMDQLIRLCPNLHSLFAHTSSPPWQPLSEAKVADGLWSVVADQWQAGTRKYLPLQIWIHGVQHGHAVTVCQDPFLTVRHVDSAFVPPNPVLATFFQEEVFIGNDDGGTPSFVTEMYDGQGEPRAPINDLVIF